MEIKELEKEGWIFPKPEDGMLVCIDNTAYSLNIPAAKGEYILQFDSKNKGRIRVKKNKEIIFIGKCDNIEYFKDICIRNKIY